MPKLRPRKINRYLRPSGQSPISRRQRPRSLQKLWDARICLQSIVTDDPLLLQHKGPLPRHLTLKEWPRHRTLEKNS